MSINPEPISPALQKLLDDTWETPVADALIAAVRSQVIAGPPEHGEDFDEHMIAAQQKTENAVDLMILEAIAMFTERATVCLKG